jgi:7-cyano-7-deazaguanine synthase
MCSIFGGLGPNLDIELIGKLQKAGTDRGRDGSKVDFTEDGKIAVGNCRAAPTHEAQHGKLQPYDGVVHNGTIANDKELGLQVGEIDSEVLPRVLDRSSFVGFVESVEKIVGSYAIACVNDSKDNLFVATNYKPIHYWSDGENVYFSSMERHFQGIVPYGTRPAVVEPYTCMELKGGNMIPLKRNDEKKALIIASAGLDSVTAAAKMKYDGYDIKLLHFVYGCKAGEKEASLIPKIAEALECEYDIVEVPYDKMKGNSSIMSGDDIDENAGMEYATEWVPARNLVFMALATAYAEANGFHYIVLGNNLEESGSHPDNEEQMTTLLNDVLDYAVGDGNKVKIISPLGNLMKREIVELAHVTKAPLQVAWSCYADGDKPCGICGPCKFRLNAFKRAGLIDPVEYEEIEEDFWDVCEKF